MCFTNKKNPLPSRVILIGYWQWFFGRDREKFRRILALRVTCPRIEAIRLASRSLLDSNWDLRKNAKLDGHVSNLQQSLLQIKKIARLSGLISTIRSIVIDCPQNLSGIMPWPQAVFWNKKWEGKVWSRTNQKMSLDELGDFFFQAALLKDQIQREFLHRSRVLHICEEFSAISYMGDIFDAEIENLYNPIEWIPIRPLQALNLTQWSSICRSIHDRCRAWLEFGKSNSWWAM